MSLIYDLRYVVHHIIHLLFASVPTAHETRGLQNLLNRFSGSVRLSWKSWAWPLQFHLPWLPCYFRLPFCLKNTVYFLKCVVYFFIGLVLSILIIEIFFIHFSILLSYLVHFELHNFWIFLLASFLILGIFIIFGTF